MSINTQPALKYIGIGESAVNKERNTDILEVKPLEILPLFQGELNDKLHQIHSSGSTGSGVHYQATSGFSATLKCKWLHNDYNRMTPPDIRRGEKVMLYMQGDSLNFYWAEFHPDDKLRSIETVVHGYKATKKPDEHMTTQNSYVSGVSPADGMVTLSATTTENGEPNKWHDFIDTKNGLRVIEADNGLHIVIDSKNDIIELKNRSIHIRMVKDTIYSKGKWHHDGEIVAKEVIGGNVVLSSHIHKVKKWITFPPIKNGWPPIIAKLLKFIKRDPPSVK